MEDCKKESDWFLVLRPLAYGIHLASTSHVIDSLSISVGYIQSPRYAHYHTHRHLRRTVPPHYSQAGFRKLNAAVAHVSTFASKGVGRNKGNVPRFSPILHVAAEHDVTASKKGPHRQLSSALGSQPATTAASFQQFICARNQHTFSP